MKIMRFNEDNGSDLYEEFESVFSYMLDKHTIYALEVKSPKYLPYSIKLLIEKEGYPDLLDYISMLKEMEECLERMAITSPLYYYYEEQGDDLVIIISRSEFHSSRLLNMQK